MEWMQSDLSVNQFLIRKGMNEYLYTKVDIKEWKKERDQIYARASAKFKTRMVNDIADKYSNYRKLWGGVEKLCEKFINRESELDAVDPMDVARISIAIEKAMKGIRLLDGSSMIGRAHV